MRHDYVWVDLEGVPEMKGYTYEIGLGRCLTNESEGKVRISWFDTLGWSEGRPQLYKASGDNGNLVYLNVGMEQLPNGLAFGGARPRRARPHARRETTRPRSARATLDLSASTSAFAPSSLRCSDFAKSSSSL